MDASVEDLLQGARAAYQGLRSRYHSLDAEIAAEVPTWQIDEHFGAQLAKICVDIALLMIGADREYTDIECQGFNILFDLNESFSDIRSLAEWLQQQRPGAAELFVHLDRFLLEVAIAERQTGLDLLEPSLDFFRTLDQVMALIDEDYHPDENRFHQELNQRLQQSPPPPEGMGLMLRLKDGSLQAWPPEA